MRFKVLLAVASVTVVSEVGIRIAGLADFPIYKADASIGYIPAPNQSGSFLRTNDWAFNERSMGTSRPYSPGPGIDILLVGDSIVFGGNPYKQVDKLGPQLEKASSATVWPISAGSWALQNELQYIRDNPDLFLSIDKVVFVLNSADMGAPSYWGSDLTHPRSHPTSALFNLLSKYVFSRFAGSSEETVRQLRVMPRDVISDLKSFSVAWGRSFDVILYPNRLERADPAAWNASMQPVIEALERADIPAMKVHSRLVIDAFEDSDYRDGIHPTPQAMGKLANLIAQVVQTQ